MGKKNIARFIIFIIMLVLSLAFIGIVGVLATLALAINDTHRFEQYFTFRFEYSSNLEKYCLIGCFLVN